MGGRVARDSHNATWRALTHIVDVLDANMATELAADAPAGLNVSAPATAAYYVMPNERAVADHLERNHPVQVYAFVSSERERNGRSRAATAKSQHSTLEVTIAVRVTEELGADAYTVSGWKTLTPKEREFLRCETYLGAVMDVLDSKSRSSNGDNIINVDFIDSRSGDDRFGGSGTWGSVRYLIHQIINVPVQTS